MSRYGALAQSFEARNLDASTFKHRDHIAVAYELLKKYDFIDATVRYAESLNAIATKAGAARKYNTTITFAFMGLIAERIDAGPDGCFDEFIAANADLLEKNPLAKWYSPERLNNDLARKIFLLPDVLQGETG
ncbi:hypothetical protein [Hoeflea sp. TYP-13]|uniref:hypothetical protein n=1 Tax=Hoeflea sp. TYP-13 TaxID=3230023 RepID=UPI0034C6BB7B